MTANFTESKHRQETEGDFHLHRMVILFYMVPISASQNEALFVSYKTYEDLEKN